VIRPTTRGSSIPVKSLQAEGTMTHASDIREQTLPSYAGSSAALRLASISARQDFWCEVPGLTLLSDVEMRMERLRPIVRRVLVPPSSMMALDDPTRVPFWRRPVSTSMRRAKRGGLTLVQSAARGVA